MKDKFLYASAFLVGLFVSETIAGNCNHFFGQQVIAVKQPIVNSYVAPVKAVAVKQAVVQHAVYPQYYRVGDSYRQESIAEKAALRALQQRDDTELRALRAELQAFRQALAVQGINAPINVGNAAQLNKDGLLRKYCAKCHGVDKASPSGAVYIDSGQTLDSSAITQSLKYLGGVEEPPAEMKKVIESIPQEDFGKLMEELLTLAQK